MSTIYHKHHIIPRHMGGSDDPSNLIELTVEEHAEAHKRLYEQHGREEDRIAWLGLSGMAANSEIVSMAYKLGRAKTDKILEERYGLNWRSILAQLALPNARKRIKELYENDSEFRERMILARLRGVEAALGDASKKKRKDSFTKIKHQQGAKNSNYGKIWISNPELKSSKTHPKNEPIPDGWMKGRKMNW